MYDVFLSYKREDRAKIEKIVQGLQKVGFKVWFDAQARISVEFIEEINNALNDSKCVVVAWSKLSVQSKFVRSEAYHAFERDRLIPLLIDDVVIPVPFNALNAADFRNWDQTYSDRCWTTLREAVGSYSKSAASQAVNDVVIPGEGRDSKVRPLAEVAAFIKTILQSADRPMLSGSIARVLRSTYPDEIEAFNFFGFARLRDLLDALAPYGIAFDSKPPGLVSLSKKMESAFPAKPAPALKQVDLSDQKPFVERLFEITDAPLLDAKRYRMVFGAIAHAIRHQAHTITSITKAARDQTIKKEAAISRDKIGYIYKGALIGGLKLEDAFITAEKVGLAFAQALNGQCGGYGWELSVDERDQLLAILGLADLG